MQELFCYSCYNMPKDVRHCFVLRKYMLITWCK